MAEQRFFKIRSNQCGQAERAVWAADDAARRDRTQVCSIAIGYDASMWTADPKQQDRLRTVLQDAGISFSENSYQQVRP